MFSSHADTHLAVSTSSPRRPASRLLAYTSHRQHAPCTLWPMQLPCDLQFGLESDSEPSALNSPCRGMGGAAKRAGLPSGAGGRACPALCTPSACCSAHTNKLTGKLGPVQWMSTLSCCCAVPGAGQWHSTDAASRACKPCRVHTHPQEHDCTGITADDTLCEGCLGCMKSSQSCQPACCIDALAQARDPDGIMQAEDFVLELGCEELPPGDVDSAVQQLHAALPGQALCSASSQSLVVRPGPASMGSPVCIPCVSSPVCRFPIHLLRSRDSSMLSKHVRGACQIDALCRLAEAAAAGQRGLFCGGHPSPPGHPNFQAGTQAATVQGPCARPPCKGELWAEIEIVVQ